MVKSSVGASLWQARGECRGSHLDLSAIDGRFPSFPARTVSSRLPLSSLHLPRLDAQNCEMADSSDKLLARLANLNDSLDDLEDQLEPLLSQTLPESLLPLETIQQVKLNVAIPYLVYDLIFSARESTSSVQMLD